MQHLACKTPKKDKVVLHVLQTFNNVGKPFESREGAVIHLARRANVVWSSFHSRRKNKPRLPIEKVSEKICFFDMPFLCLFRSVGLDQLFCFSFLAVNGLVFVRYNNESFNIWQCCSVDQNSPEITEPSSLVP